MTSTVRGASKDAPPAAPRVNSDQVGYSITPSQGKRRRWLRKFEEDREEDWWFASTAIPLIAATIGPLANVFSIAAYVSSWRMDLDVGPDGSYVPELQGQSFPDPHWCLDVNIASLACGFLGNLFLLANFTNRVRYIIALPATIILWYMSTGMLIGITVGMNMYAAPVRPEQTYTQGFWYAVYAAILYLVCSMILMVNMLGYFLGHYPQHFSLTDAQRTLILQTMMFFIWLAGGGGIFSLVGTKHDEQGWAFVDALYFCDVTILTVGFGDLYSQNDVGRGLVFPYSVGGIIMLGLVISSISRFVGEISQDKIMKKRAESKRTKTIERSMPDETARRSLSLRSTGQFGDYISKPVAVMRRSSVIKQDDGVATEKNQPIMQALKRTSNFVLAGTTQRRGRKRALILREEKDRFEAMRNIQASMKSFQQWTALAASIVVFSILWCVGAAVFYVTEASVQGLSYFEALYFCYVSLLTIGYGDLAPKSNAGRPFFVVWSLLAVPTMTILVSTLGDTVINRFKSGTSKLADFTILPKYGIWAEILQKLQARRERVAVDRRLEAGFETGPVETDDSDLRHHVPTLDELAVATGQQDEHHLARALAAAIRRTAHDLKEGSSKRYTYEEWVELTELIRFTSPRHQREGDFDEDDALIDWDWIGENSPMMHDKSEPEFVLDRLCESMSRFIRKRIPNQPEDQDGHKRLNPNPTRQLNQNLRTDSSVREEEEGEQ